MKKYLVVVAVSTITYERWEVEAEDEDVAWEKALAGEGALEDEEDGEEVDRWIDSSHEMTGDE